ncbi:MAG: CBS domain-containing protein [bacterium]|nr:CBS domain-containing protein [bacterium]
MNYTADLAAPAASPAALARDFMVVKHPTLKPDMPILKAVDLFLKTGVTGAPVVDQYDRLLGILTEKDCIKLLAKRSYYHEEPERTVADDMATGIKTVDAQTDLQKIVDIFLGSPFRQLPVVDADNRLVGMISRRDVVQVIQKMNKRR